MTSISNVYGLVVGLDTFSDDTIKYTTTIAISLAVFTWFYTSIAGLPASIVTDKFQAYLMFSLVFILLIVACANPNNRISKEEYAVASNWTADGLVAAITLIIAVCCAEMFNQGTWQRVWAAKSVKEMRIGFLIGSGFVFLLMMFFGIMGMIAYGKLPLFMFAVFISLYILQMTTNDDFLGTLPQLMIPRLTTTTRNSLVRIHLYCIPSSCQRRRCITLLMYVFLLLLQTSHSSTYWRLWATSGTSSS